MVRANRTDFNCTYVTTLRDGSKDGATLQYSPYRHRVEFLAKERLKIDTMNRRSSSLISI